MIENWNAVVEVINSAIPVGFGCPLVGFIVTLTEFPALSAISIDPVSNVK